MLGRELVDELRESYLDDINLPYLWQPNELIRNLNRAEVQATRRAHLLIDSTTANDSGTAGTASTMGQMPLCKLTIVADQAVYRVSPKILQVRRLQLQSMTYPLTGPVSFAELDEVQSGWFGTSGTIGTAGSGGYPTYFLNEPNNMVTIVLAPSASDTAFLTVSRLPLISFTLQTSPEIDEQHHDGLLDWAAHLCFAKPDSETRNDNLAKYYSDKFTERFGPLSNAYGEKMKKTLSQMQRMRPREFGS
jgi:hypothetical protein